MSEQGRVAEPATPAQRFMTWREFHAQGFLRELNRCFLHPLGLALEVVTNGAGEVTGPGRIWDYRSDPEGIRYAGFTDEQVHLALEQAAVIERLAEDHRPAREALFGTLIQPVRAIADPVVEEAADDGDRER